MGVVTDARAKRAARRVLGVRARRARQRADGSVIVDVNGQVLLYRRHRGRTYFRFVVPCAVCGKAAITWRGARISSAHDLESMHPPPLMCDRCLERRIAAQSEHLSVSDELEQRGHGGQPAPG
jgi:hypothetical protein